MEPLLDRTADRAVMLEKPQSLYAIIDAISNTFQTRVSIEPLPEECLGSNLTPTEPPPFEIYQGESFGAVIERFEAISQGRWKFEEIHGVPVFHPDGLLEGHATLLDTMLTVEINANSVWEALCALALAVNETNKVPHSDTRPLLITFSGPAVLKLPPAHFIEEKAIRISLNQVTAREGLCAVLATLDTPSRYLYHCIPEGSSRRHAYITISALSDTGRVIDGGRIRDDFQELLETKAWMSTVGLMEAQIPSTGKVE